MRSRHYEGAVRTALLFALLVASAKPDAITTLRHGKNFPVRLRAVMTILRTHDPAQLDGLMKAAHDEQPMTRALVAIALSGYTQPEAQPILDVLSKDSVDIVKRSAAAALSDINDHAKQPKPPPPPPPAPSGERALRAKSGPRLALDDLQTKNSPEVSLPQAARLFTEALDDSPTPLWTGETATSAHKATYTLIGSADWTEKKAGADQLLKVRLHGLVQKLPAHKLLGEVTAQGAATLPPGLSSAERVNTLQSMLKKVVDASLGDVIDTINVDREQSGEPLLR